jgi:phosphoribosyl-ATP pyrophosphohydrolase/phosphoribosyl-AMP cyclohydrolase
MNFDGLTWNDADLVTVVVQDQHSGEIRMLAHANRQALQETLRTGLAHFYSRSRKALWCKGETSGNSIAVTRIYADCDGDALIYLAEPSGPSCHTGEPTCFFRPVTEDGVAPAATSYAQPTLAALWKTLELRRQQDADRSYTRRLLEDGAEKIGAKITEEASELVEALTRESDERVVSEAADLLFHTLVGLLHRDLTLRDVEAELARRFGTSGLVEKANRPAKSQP